MEYFQRVQKERLNRLSKTMLGVTSVASTIIIGSGCAQGNESSQSVSASEDFPRPIVSAPYFLDDTDPYYDNLRQTLDLVDDPVMENSIRALMRTPVAAWLNGDNESTKRLLKENLHQSMAAGEVPIFVAYNIPKRDLGGEAKGGLSSPDEYRAWIELISEAIDDKQAVLVLEPDAMAGILQMNDKDQEQRIVMLRDALSTLRLRNAHTAVYLDAGNSEWLTAEQVEGLLRRIDPTDRLIGGIALNVANQQPVRETTTYGRQISEKMGRMLKILIDTSMTGAEVPDSGQPSAWCNSPGEKIGSTDGYFDSSALVEDAFLKTPGESDGRCGTSSMRAGEFDPQLLIRQLP